MFTLSDVELMSRGGRCGSTRYVTVNGETKPLYVWCRLAGINQSTVHQRIRMRWVKARWFECTARHKRLSAWLLIFSSPEITTRQVSDTFRVDMKTARRWRKEVLSGG